MKKPSPILRLKYRLEPIENDRFEFQILEQNIRFPFFFHYEAENWIVRHYYSPNISTNHNVIYLCGKNPDHNNMITICKGHRHMKHIHKALELFIKSKFGQCKVIKS